MRRVSENNGTEESNTTSPSPTLLQRLDVLDRGISRPLFLAKLPAVIEYIWSVPGNFFGVPVVTLLVTPNALAMSFSDDHLLSTLWHYAVWSLTFISLILWTFVISGNRTAIRIFYGPSLGAAAGVLGVLLLSHMPDVSSSSFPTATAARKAGYFQIAAWSLSVIPVALLKPSIARWRPVMMGQNNEHNDLSRMDMKRAAEDKHLNILPRFFQRDARASFPSGDAAGAVAVAYSIGRRYSLLLSLLVVVLSATGRMYWQAHYAGDVIAGAALAWVCCLWLDQTIVWAGGESCQAEQWHALSANGALLVTVVLSRLYFKAKVFHSGTIRLQEVQKKF